MSPRLRAHYPDALILAFILVAGRRFTWAIDRLTDIGLYDESTYLASGLHLASRGLPDAESAPGYAIWYYGLSRFEPDPIQIYYLNQKLTALLPPLFIFGLLRASGLSAPPSLVAALLFLVSNMNLPISPRVVHPALLLVLTAVTAASLTRSWASVAVVTAVCAWLAALFRPEYSLSFWLAFILLVIVAARTFRKLERRHRAAALGACGILLLLGFLLPHPDSQRAWEAFTQHFALNWTQWTGSRVDPFTNSTTIAASQFGSATTLPRAFLNNPGIFSRHIGTNVAGLVWNSLNLVFPIFIGIDDLAKRALSLIMLLLLLLQSAGLRKRLLQHSRALLAVGMLLPTGLLSAVVIYPRPHYLLIPVVLAVVALLLLTCSSPQTSAAPRGGQLLLYGLIILVVISSASLPPSNQDNLKTIRFIRSLHITQPVQLLEAEGGFDVYSGDNYRRVAQYDKVSGFNEFLGEKQINMVVITEALLTDTRLASDAEWQRFLSNAYAMGFVSLVVPATNRTLLLRPGLLP